MIPKLFLLVKIMNTVGSRYLEYSISRTLLYLRQFIRSLGHVALDQSKKLSHLESRYFKYLPMSNKISVPLSSFQFLKISRTFSNFSSHISLFQLPLAHLLQLCRQEWVKTQINIFFFLHRIFWFDFFIARRFNKASP